MLIYMKATLLSNENGISQWALRIFGEVVILTVHNGWVGVA